MSFDTEEKRRTGRGEWIKLQGVSSKAMYGNPPLLSVWDILVLATVILAKLYI